VPPSSSAGAIIVLIAYGYQAQNKEDSMIALAESAMVKFKLLRNPGSYLVDFIPLCMLVSSHSRALESSLTPIDSEICPAVVSRGQFQERSLRCKEIVGRDGEHSVSIFCAGNGHHGCLRYSRKQY